MDFLPLNPNRENQRKTQAINQGRHKVFTSLNQVIEAISRNP